MLKLNRKWVTIAIVAVLVLSFGGLVATRVKQKNERTAALKNMAPPPPAVAVSTPRKGTLSTKLTLSGSVVAQQEVQLVPKASGRLMTLFVDEGSPVRQGQLLGEIDHLELDAQIAQARASIASSKANLDMQVNGPLKAQIDQARASVNQLEATLRQTQVNLAQQQSDLQRNENLAAQGVITQQQVETSRTQVQVSQQQLAGLQQQINGAKAALQLQLDGTRPEQIAQARAQYQQAQATLQLYQAQLANYRLIAPMSGVVSNRQLDPGSLVAAPNPILTITQSMTPELEIFAPERELANLKVGQAIEVKSPAFPGQTFSASIKEINPVVDPQSRLVKLKARLTSQGALKPGMLLECSIITERRDNTLILPVHAVVQNEKNQSEVYVAVANKVEARPVTLGLRNPSEVEVRTGLKPQDQVIVTGTAFLRPGDKIQVQPGIKEAS